MNSTSECRECNDSLNDLDDSTLNLNSRLKDEFDMS